mmetsp:Transcript_48771/g.109703  ORF Transcript_48771/g.109703 Transcript_48771/m.109703 type:complete len:181 (-) Transcript_48771:8-550(-)
MGGCESCASSRRKEVALFLNEKMTKGTPAELRAAIQSAEAFGIETLPARRQYSELERSERHAPEHTAEMVRWAMSTQDGVILYNVIQEAADKAAASDELKAARLRLLEHQDEARLRLHRLAKNKDARGMVVVLDRARHMGIPPSDLTWAEQYLRSLEESQAVRREVVGSLAPSTSRATVR